MGKTAVMGLIRGLSLSWTEFRRSMPRGALKDVKSCAPCMARWIVAGAASRDAETALHQVTPTGAVACDVVDMARVAAIQGLPELLSAVQLPNAVVGAFVSELEELGAASVSELLSTDWEKMGAFVALRPLQKRRLVQYVGCS